MQKSKRPPQKKLTSSPEKQDEALSQHLAALALDLARQEGRGLRHKALTDKEIDLRKTIKKSLIQKKDEVLHDALERTKEENSTAYRFLKEQVEEAAGTVVFRRDDGRDLEVNAFIIPLLVRTHGGLHQNQSFQDEDAFERLTKSLQEAQLESRDAKVILISHAYHPDEIVKIRYSQLNEMVREAFDSMTSKKVVAAPAIERSLSGWPENHFASEDEAVELRFLLGFALKRMDDAFYQVPEEEAAADRYFEVRATRFHQWAEQVLPLARRCLVTDGREAAIHFLYQDLFHGGKERGFAEYATLQMMSDLHHDLQAHQLAPDATHAVIGPAEIDDNITLQVNLYAQTDGALVATSEKPLHPAFDLALALDDAYDALMTMGVVKVELASGFDADGNPLNIRPYAT